MEVKVIDKDEFYSTYVQWSNHYGFAARYIDEIDTVVACYKEDMLLYTCFFWRTNSAFCIIGFPFANPYISKEDKEGGMVALFEGIAKLAKQAGFRMIFTTSDTPPVEEALQQAGFLLGDMKVNQYFGILAAPSEEVAAKYPCPDF